MIDGLPVYVTVVFVLATLLTIALLLYALRASRTRISSKLLVFLLPFWMVVTAMLASGGFYRQFDAFPPRVVAFAVIPALLLIAAFFAFFRADVERSSLRSLTLLHIVRVPVEVVLLWLFQHGQVPQVMTFEGSNFDILSGLSAPVIYWLGFRRGTANRLLLIVWNVLALALLANIVITAVLSFPSPAQRFGFEQPNVGVTYFPYIWLPAIIVPAVLFAHLAALWKLSRGQTS